MSGTAFIIGLVLCLLLLVFNWTIGLIPAVCMLFTVIFWGSLIILAGGLILSVVLGIVTRDVSCFKGVLLGGLMICVCGLFIAFCVFLLAVVLDAARIVLKIVGIDQQAPITFERLFFPWRAGG